MLSFVIWLTCSGFLFWFALKMTTRRGAVAAAHDGLDR